MSWFNGRWSVDGMWSLDEWMTWDRWITCDEWMNGMWYPLMLLRKERSHRGMHSFTHHRSSTDVMSFTHPHVIHWSHAIESSLSYNPKQKPIIDHLWNPREGPSTILPFKTNYSRKIISNIIQGQELHLISYLSREKFRALNELSEVNSFNALTA